MSGEDCTAITSAAMAEKVGASEDQQVLDRVRSVEIVLDQAVQISTIAQFRHLTSLCIIGEPSLRSLDGVDSLRQLKALWVNQCQLEDATPLKWCMKLQRLYLCGNRLQRFSVSGLSELQALWLNDNQLSVLPNMAKFRSLRQLWVANNKLNAVSQALLGNDALEELNVAANKIYSIDEVTGLRILRQLSRLWLSDIHFGDNPVCRLPNWKITVLHQLPGLLSLNGDVLTEEHRFTAHAIHGKKRIAYAVRSNAVNFLICDLSRKVQKRAGQVRWKNNQQRRQLVRRIKTTTSDITRKEAIMKLEALEELEQLMLVKTSNFLRHLEEEKQMLLAAALLEYSSGGNVRLEAIHPQSSFLLSVTQNLNIQDNFNSSCAIGCAWDIDRAYSIHNNGINIQFEDFVAEVTEPERQLYAATWCDPGAVLEAIRDMMSALQHGQGATAQMQPSRASSRSVSPMPVAASGKLRVSSTLRCTHSQEGDVLVLLLLTGFPTTERAIPPTQLHWLNEHDESYCAKPVMILQLRTPLQGDDEQKRLSDGERVRTHRTASTDSISSDVWIVEQSEDAFADEAEQIQTTSSGLFAIESTFLCQQLDRYSTDLANFVAQPDVQWMNATPTEPLASPEFAQFPCAEKITVVGYNLSKFTQFHGYFKLQELTASFAGLVQLDPIAQLESLRVLDVSYNKIGCVSVLTTASRIERLNISHNRVSDLRDVLQLRSLARLCCVELWGNPFCKGEFVRAKLIESFGDAFRCSNPERLSWLDGVDAAQSADVQHFVQTPNLLVAIHAAWSAAVLGSWDVRHAKPNRDCAHQPIHTAVVLSGGRERDFATRNFENLSVLCITNCDVEALHASQLSAKLEELYLSGVALPPLSALQGLTRLRRLDLSNNGLRSLSGMPALRRLAYLSLNNNKLTSLDNVMELDGVAELYATHNDMTDLRCISSLRSLNRLAVLSLAGNPMTEGEYRLYVLFKIKNLKILDGQRVTSKEAAQAANVFAGRLTLHDLQDMLPGQHLQSLAVLNVSNSGLRDISELTVLQNLKELVANFNEIDRYCELQKLQHLRKLELVENRIRKLCGPESGRESSAAESTGFPALEVLNLSKNKLQELHPNCAQMFQMLKHLDVSHNMMERVENLQGCSALAILRLGFNKLRSIEDLKSLPTLRELSLEGNPLRFINTVELPSLTSVDLSNTKLSDYSHVIPFAECAVLRSLSLISSPLSLRPLYRFYVIRLLPTLLLLDGQQVMPEEKETQTDSGLVCFPNVNYSRAGGGVYPLENKKLAHNATKVAQQQLQIKHNLIALPLEKLSPKYRRPAVRPPLLWHSSST